MPLAYGMAEQALKVAGIAVKRLERAFAYDQQPVRSGLGYITREAGNIAYAITHQDTATLYKSYLKQQDIGTSGAFSTIYVDPSVVNPRGYRPAVYAQYEFGRGGSHDAFQRVVDASDTYINPGIDIITEMALRELR